ASSAGSLKKGKTASLDLFVRSHLEVGVPLDPSRLKRVRSSEVLETFLGIRSDYLRLCAASYVGEMVSRCVQEEDPAREIFGLLRVILGMLEKGAGIYRSLFIFEGRLLRELGLAPDTTACRECGGRLERHIRIAPALGGFCHGACLPGDEDSLFFPGDMNILRFILDKDLAALPRLGVEEGRAKILFTELHQFSIHHLGFSPKTTRNLP
ncbi:MAG: DNA repair protein RecO, partial [Deltaproteobacteria bacterium]|nr:DNA repair protein RecO [Deltaproteobacteria bacterium]